MATERVPRPKPPEASEAPISRESLETQHRAKIRNRLITILTLLVVILLLFGFLVNYSGFYDAVELDTSLLIFAAVSVNIVVLTTVFYLILRNLFKLVYERRRLLAGVRLKTKLIIAFVALSLPSAGFHLMASGFMAFLFENWSEGEYRQVLDGAKVISGELTAREDDVMRLRTAQILADLPRNRAAFAQSDWLYVEGEGFEGGVFVYDPARQVIARWVSSDAVSRAWHYPAEARFRADGEHYWRERFEGRTLRRALLPLEGADEPLRVEVFDLSRPRLAGAMELISRKERNRRLVGRDLGMLVLTFLIVMTLLIIFAATWIAFYLARGFVTPIERLDAATHRVAEGELGYQVDQATLGPMEADFAGLVGSFNAMSGQLREQNLKLVQNTEDLRTSHHALGERNRLVELLLENIDAGIISLDDAGRVTALNRTAKRLLSLHTDGHAGRPYSEVLGSELTALLDELREQRREKGWRQVSRNLTLSSGADPLIIELTLMALEERGGGTEGPVVMLKDVSAMQRHQRALAWGEVARRVAHEIKNPLTPIQLSAQRIRRRYLEQPSAAPDVLDQCTRTIINEVTSLKKMVNEFSEFAQLPESRPLPGSMNDVIEEVAALYGHGLPENVRMELRLADDLPELPLDREQLKRVFTNLIDNAAAAVSSGGVITVRSAYDAEQRAVLVDVMDDGTGVPEHVRSRMFEPYTSTKEGGTGLGLTIVNQIVSDHNGYVRYSERKPRGTVFSMEFRLR